MSFILRPLYDDYGFIIMLIFLHANVANKNIYVYVFLLQKLAFYKEGSSGNLTLYSVIFLYLCV